MVRWYSGTLSKKGVFMGILTGCCSECFHEWVKRKESPSKKCPKCQRVLDRKSTRYGLDLLAVGDKKMLKFPFNGSWSTSQCIDRFEKKTGRRFLREVSVYGILVTRVE